MILDFKLCSSHAKICICEHQKYPFPNCSMIDSSLQEDLLDNIPPKLMMTTP